jgi:Tfp pilus assembly protein PilO
MNKNAIGMKPADALLIVAVLLILGVTYYVTIPQAKKLQGQRQQVVAKEAELAQLKKRIDTLNVLQPQLASRKTEVDKLTIAFPSEEQAAEALIQSKTMIEEAGLSIASLAPTKGVNGSLPVNMVLKGSFQALDTLLRGFKTNLRPIIVKNYTAAAGEDENRSLLNVNILTSFEYNKASSVTATPATTPPAQ